MNRHFFSLLFGKAALAVLFLHVAAPVSQAAGPINEPVVIYRVVTTDNSLTARPDQFSRKSYRGIYFLIVDRITMRYRIVEIFPKEKTFKHDEVTHSFSQVIFSTDSAGRERLVLSLAGPGRQWVFTDGEIFTDAYLDTSTGLIRPLPTRTPFGPVTLGLPSVLRGKGRAETAHLDNETRLISTSRTLFRYQRRLTQASNQLGGGLAFSQADVVRHLQSRGWTNFFAAE